MGSLLNLKMAAVGARFIGQFGSWLSPDESGSHKKHQPKCGLQRRCDNRTVRGILSSCRHPVAGLELKTIPAFQRGFTLVELVMTMVIIGIIAAVAVPRFFDSNVFQSRGFADQVKATLRFAQKTAIAQHRFVCVEFTASSIKLTINTTASCPGSDLTSPAGQTPYTVSAPSGVTLSGYTSPMYFDALGRSSAGQTISVTGATDSITVETETGYVH
jgi:MSHA pilin protein MshC